MVIVDFVTLRHHSLRLVVAGLPPEIYKDANIRNFLLTDHSVVIIDFDELTLPPFGYNLARLILTGSGWPHSC
ncbi:MAG: hypothetical protein ACRDQ4_17960 [Pseudonocardiaceae bacterium]